MSCLSTTMQCQSCSWFDQQQGCMVVYHLLSKGVHPSCSMTKNRTVTLTPYTIKFSTAHLGLYTKKAELLNKPWQRACVPKKSLRLSNCSQREDIQFSPFVWLCLSKSFQIELIHFVHCITGAYPLPSSCGWQEMDKKQQWSHATVPGYQEDNEVKQAISIRLECTKSPVCAVRNKNHVD